MRLKNETIIERFEKTVLANQERVVMTCQGNSFTWTELEELSNKLAVTLLDLKIKQGDKVAIWSGNSPAWIIAYLALAKIGAISVLINHKYKEDELISILKYSDVKYLCYGNNQSELEIEEIVQEIKMKSIEEIKGFIPIGEKALDSWIKTDISRQDYLRIKDIKKQFCPEDTASMLFTSGTSGKPKGVMLAHFQLINVARQMVEAMHWTKDDQVCMSLPLFHCFGLSTGLLATLIHGGTVHFPGSYHSEDVMSCIEKNCCNVLNGVPSMFLAILHNQHRDNYDLSSLDSGIIAGSGVYKDDFLKIVRELGMNHLMQSFGQTEASPSISFSGYEDPLELRAESVGRKIEHLDLRIRNLKTGEINPPFIEGEIEISGYNVMQGYYKNERETKKVLREDGWLRTGDIGYLDTAGNLYISGRLKEIIIRCGENISPKEIEEVILEDSRIREVKVLGIPMPVVQEEIAACVESTTVEEDVLKERLMLRLADYKIPKYIIFYEQFPQLPSGKIDINKLKEDVLKKLNEEAKR